MPPRMSKKRKLEWTFFLNHRNRIIYNGLCRKCAHGCKQSFRAVVIENARVIYPNEPKEIKKYRVSLSPCGSRALSLE